MEGGLVVRPFDVAQGEREGATSADEETALPPGIISTWVVEGALLSIPRKWGSLWGFQKGRCPGACPEFVEGAGVWGHPQQDHRWAGGWDK